MNFGPCAKRRVRCTIITESGATFTGENVCRNPQTVCPRSEGEGYEKCISVCGQVGHAEVVAATAKLHARNRELGTAFVQGHHYACDACKGMLLRAGVDRVFCGEERI